MIPQLHQQDWPHIHRNSISHDSSQKPFKWFEKFIVDSRDREASSDRGCLRNVLSPLRYHRAVVTRDRRSRDQGSGANVRGSNALGGVLSEGLLSRGLMSDIRVIVWLNLWQCLEIKTYNQTSFGWYTLPYTSIGCLSLRLFPHIHLQFLFLHHLKVG